MADPISIQCPHCKVKLKLKAAPPAGKQIGCPKCKKPFLVKVPPKKKESDDDFLDALDSLAEDDYEAPEDEVSQEDDEDAPPARSVKRSKSSVSTTKGGKGKKGRLKKSSAGPLLAIIGGSVAVLALLVGLVYLLMNLPGGAKVIRSVSGEFIAFAPADAELFVAARPADLMASPLLASVVQDPNVKQGLTEMERSLGFPVTEIEHVFTAIKMDPNVGKGGAPAGPMAGNPMMGMPGMGGGNGSGVQESVVILRLKQPYGGKTLDQIRQQSPPKTHNDVSYHVSAEPKGGAFFFGDERHVVIGEPSQIEKIIDRKDQAENKDLLAYFAKEQHVSLVAIQKGTEVQTNLPPQFSQTLQQNETLQKLVKEVSMIRMDANMPAGVDLKVSLTCKSAAAAQQIHTEATKEIDALKQQAQILKFAIPEIDGVLNSLKVNQSGMGMDVSVSVPSTMIDRMKQMASQSPGAGAAGQSPGTLPIGTSPSGSVPAVTPPTTVPPQN